MDFEKQDTSWPARISMPGDHNINLIDGYLTAARILLEATKKDHTLSDELVNPLIYLYRHHLELKIKTIWQCLWQLEMLPSNFPKHHRILDIWIECKSKLVKLSEITPEQEAIIQSCFEEFHKIDPQGENFRFHQAKNGKRIIHAVGSLDINGSSGINGKLTKVR